MWKGEEFFFSPPSPSSLNTDVIANIVVQQKKNNNNIVQASNTWLNTKSWHFVNIYVPACVCVRSRSKKKVRMALTPTRTHVAANSSSTSSSASYVFLLQPQQLCTHIKHTKCQMTMTWMNGWMTDWAEDNQASCLTKTAATNPMTSPHPLFAWLS